MITSVFLFACKKDEKGQLYEINKQEILLKELGFDLSKVTIQTSVTKNNALIFGSIEEAKAFFKPFTNKKMISSNVNKLKNIKSNEDLLSYIKEKALLINSQDIKTLQANANAGTGTGTDDPEDDSDIFDPPAGTADMSAWTLWTGYHLSFNFQTDAYGHISVTGVSSNLIGVHPGVSWEQSPTQFFVNYSNSAIIHFDVMGYQNYNIIVEDLGTVFTQSVHLVGEYNTKTGVYTLEAQ